jgi:hypothetical protein
MRYSKTIETQTTEVEEPSLLDQSMNFDDIEISIPETKSIKDG